MAKEIKNENLNLCRECGGMCCKKSGCDYSADDFDNCSYNGLFYEVLMGKQDNVSEMELMNIKGFASFLMKDFPYELNNAPKKL